MYTNTNRNTNIEGFQCDFRKKHNGKMCNEKWGEPKCGNWKKNPKIKEFEESKQTNILKGYYKNPYMYEIDYEEEEKDKENNEINLPKGIHSSFF